MPLQRKISQPTSLVTKQLPSLLLSIVYFRLIILQQLLMVSQPVEAVGSEAQDDSEVSDDSFLDQPRDRTSKYKRIIAGLSDDIEV